MRLPTLFLSHGSPMTAVEPGPAGAAWADLGRALPRPRAILVASAHWETDTPRLTGTAMPETIHDFGGFPDVLYTLRYPAPGAPDVAAEAAALLREAGFDAGIDARRGLDHGAWVPLLHMFPQADVPVVQLSLQTERGAAHHLALGAAIAPLAERGVLVLGSGHVTHNLRDWMASLRQSQPQPLPLPYVAAFADWIAAALAANDRDALDDYRRRAPEAARAHPTEEHFLPLHVAWGAAGEDARVERVVAGFEAGALAMHSWLFHPAH